MMEKREAEGVVGREGRRTDGEMERERERVRDIR